MKKYVLVVIAIVLTFLTLIITYTMTPPDESQAKGAPATAAKH